MSCSNCFTKYGLVTREHGCPVCHMSLCARCLPEKLPMPGSPQKKISVCRKCYNKATTIEEEAPPLLPPEAIKRQLEDLENPARPPITVYRRSPKTQSLKRGLSHQDSELVDRLEALKADRKRKSVPSESEMAARLAALKGETPASGGGGGPSSVPPPERRSAAEQERDLVSQARDQLAMEHRHRPEAGLQERLERLRGASVDEPPAHGQESASGVPPSTDEQSPDQLLAAVTQEVKEDVERANQIAQRVADIHHRLESSRTASDRGDRPSGSAQAASDEMDASEEEEVQKLIQQMKERALLEEKELNEELESLSSAGEEELPWCCICNNDAVVRCLGCGMDLYCRSCFREGHSDDLRDHETVPFPGPK